MVDVNVALDGLRDAGLLCASCIVLSVKSDGGKSSDGSACKVGLVSDEESVGMRED